MKFNKVPILLSFLFITLLSCGKDPDPDPVVVKPPVNYAYDIHFEHPMISKNVFTYGEELHVHVDFESHQELMVHNVQVRVFNKKDSAEIFKEPTDSHVMSPAGDTFNFHKKIILDSSNGFNKDNDYVIHARVWAEEEGDDNDKSVYREFYLKE